MRQLTRPSRRRFGLGLATSLTLSALPRSMMAHGGPKVVEVRISRFTFVPEKVDIHPGDTVVWINDDLAPHTATSNDGDWETTPLDSGASAHLVFETGGDFDYFCAFHPHMTGTVSVRS